LIPADFTAIDDPAPGRSTDPIAARQGRIMMDAAGRDAERWTSSKAEILEAARRLIVANGYHEFSMRSVAEASAMHLKSLQYHFRTKKDLIDAVVTYTLEKSYLETYERLFEAKASGDPNDRFAIMLDYLLDDLSDPFHIGSIGDAIARINPGIGAAEIGERSALIAMQIEGLVLIIGHGKRKHPEFRDLKTAAKRHMIEIALAPART
jgi:AcrR family transcriptional regulator